MAKKSTPTYSDGKTQLTENQKDVLYGVVGLTAARELAVNGRYSVKVINATLHGLQRLGMVAKTTIAFYDTGDRKPLFRDRHIWTLTRKGAAWLMVAEREE